MKKVRSSKQLRLRSEKNSTGSTFKLTVLLTAMSLGSCFAANAMAQQTTSATSASDSTESAAALPEITVGDSNNAASTETAVGSKMPLTQREIAQSVSVLTKQQMEQQGVEDLEGALNHIPGVTVEKIDSNRMNFYSRGYAIDSIQYDGVPTAYDSRQMVSPDMVLYERVEVLKGPAALFAGTSGSGGSINLVRKRPTDTFQASGELSIGSWNNRRTELDVSGPLNESGTLRGRLVGSYQERNFYYDHASAKNGTIYGVVDYKISPDTRATLGYSNQYVSTKGQPWTLPAYISTNSSGVTTESLLNISRSSNLGASFSHEEFHTQNAFAELEHQFSGGWAGKLSTTWQKNHRDALLAYVFGGVDASTNQESMFVSGGPQDQRQNSYDANIGGPFSLFGREHKVVVGANYNVSTYATADYSSSFSQTIDITNPTYYYATPDFTADGTGQSIRSEQYGTYGNLRFSLAEPLTLVIGGRSTWWHSTSTQYTTTTSTDTNASVSAKFTKQIGLIYDINNAHSVYASYTDVFQPQSYTDQNGALLKPVQGKQEEVGIKSIYFDGALATSLALFHLNEQGRAQSVTDSSGDTLYYVASGATSNRGLELTVNGRVKPNWDIYGGYTYIISHDLPNPSDTSLSSMSAIAPRHLLRVGTDYRFTGDWNAINIGGNVNVRSRIYSLDADNNYAVLAQGGYATVDLHAGYKVNKNVRLALNVTNLFDRYYYQRVNSAKSGNILGEPRAVTLTMHMSM